MSSRGEKTAELLGALRLEASGLRGAGVKGFGGFRGFRGLGV